MQARLRTLIDQVARSAEADAVLLRRFVSTRDSAAFAELVRRYGRLVWGQCRHLLASEADTDDAFQATFLTLSRAARTLKDTNKLGPWLHGVAYRVCLNAKRLAARRTKREKATAKPEAVRPVADSAWDAAFAAVHDELAKLPDTLRVPFVLCVLEGKGVTQAAEQLGLKLGTFSARLSRAKQQLFERLNARGLTAGLATVGAVALGASGVPAAAVTKACDLAAGGTAPANILSLSHGVLGMAAMNAKRWVMAAVLAGGLTAGVGGVWSANAQEKPKPVQEQPGKPADPVKAELLQLQEMLKAEQAKRQDLEAQYKKQAADAKLQAAEAERAAKEKKPEWTKKNQEGKVPEFLYLHQKAGYSPNADELEKAVRPVEAKGYTFVGVVTMKWLDGSFTEQVVPTLVFRHTPVKGAADSDEVEIRRGVVTREAYLAEKAVEEKVLADRYAAKEKALRAEIEVLTVELAELRKLQTPATGPQARLPLPQVRLPLTQLGGADDGSQLVTKLIRLRYGEKAAGGLSFDTSKDALLVSGLSKEQAGWLWETVYGLVGPMSSERK